MLFFDNTKNSINQNLGVINGHNIFIKREDLLHPLVSGNKFRKLKFIFKEIIDKKIPVAITFGGAFSNHLLATAVLGNELGVRTIGIVRGQEWEEKICDSDTLAYCASKKMQLIFISRIDYKKKEKAVKVQQIFKKNPQYRLIPEGGTEPLGVKGCLEILNPTDSMFDVVCSSIGTGGTLAGLIQSISKKQMVLGFNALNSFSTEKVIKQYTLNQNWGIINDFTFGGYAKTTTELINFMNDFYEQYRIPLDPIYTGKMLFAIFELIKKNQWRWGKNILVIHTGGLQGISGMNKKLEKKKSVVLSYWKNLP